ncbi:MAG: PTS mannitol transporter subunit IICBA [Nocardioides sp.]
MSTTKSAPETHAPPRVSARVHVQRVGTFLSNMIMPNIAAIIAWGLITAFFIPDGWIPNEKIATMVGPSIYYLLPILIAYTGGKLIYDTRGGVVGAASVMGVIMATSAPEFIGVDGTGSPMFLGAMIMGPLAALVMKHLDGLWAHKIRPGFEMLVNNFSAGIWAGIAAILGMFLLAPVLRQVIDWLGQAVNFLVENDLLPLTSVFIEPAKVLFLNNAINHGVLTPLGIQQATESGKSVLFLLEANPGPGLGILMAYAVFGRGIDKASAPGAAIIQFFGGIHEVYFPYVLMKPKMILAAIAGGMTGVFLFTLTDIGLRAPAAPGSIIAVYAQTPGGDFFGVTLGVFGSALVTFVVGGLLLKTDRSTDEGDLAGATGAMEDLKGKASVASTILTGTAVGAGRVRSIVFACDAGMGSSAMGASVLRKKIHDAGYGDVTVVNQAISSLRDDHDIVVTHQDLTDRARQKTPSAVHVSVDNFMASPRYDEVLQLVEARNAVGGPVPTESVEPATTEPRHAAGLLVPESIVLDGGAASRDDAITTAGELLVAAGAVDPAYVEAMHARELSVSTAMGNLLAIPHGTNEAKADVKRTALSFVRYPGGLDWNGREVKYVVGVAALGNEHLKLMARLAAVFTDPEQVRRLEEATTTHDVLEVLGEVQPA